MKKYFVSLLEIGVNILDKNVWNIDTSLLKQGLFIGDYVLLKFQFNGYFLSPGILMVRLKKSLWKKLIRY